MNMKNVQAILFDMDGVLVDVSQSYRLATQHTAEHFLGIPIQQSEITAFKNQGGYNNDWDLTKALIQKHGKQVSREQVIDRFQQLYLSDNFNGFILNETLLLAKNNLEKLQKSYTLGIVTGRPRAEAEHVLQRFNIDGFFSVLIAMEDTPVGKPDPAGINQAMQKLSVSSAIYIGDTVDDMKAACAAGIDAVGVLNGLEDDRIEDLKKYGAVIVVNETNQICEIVL